MEAALGLFHQKVEVCISTLVPWEALFQCKRHYVKICTMCVSTSVMGLLFWWSICSFLTKQSESNS